MKKTATAEKQLTLVAPFQCYLYDKTGQEWRETIEALHFMSVLTQPHLHNLRISLYSDAESPGLNYFSAAALMLFLLGSCSCSSQCLEYVKGVNGVFVLSALHIYPTD